MRQDMVILNNYVRPYPVFKKKITSRHASENECFKNLFLKMLGLSNMINLMNISAMNKAYMGI